MGKIKELVITIIEEYESGMSIADIAYHHQISISTVEQVIRDFG